MGRPAGWMQQLTGRGAMRSPGAPSHHNEMERRLWMEVATGVTSEEAAETIGVSPAVGPRWFRQRGWHAIVHGETGVRTVCVVRGARSDRAAGVSSFLCN